MEKNIHHDPLDDYVRRSFDDHEENPASDMWSRIEAELPDAPAGRTWRGFFLRNRLRLAAAVILLLLSGLVCEHFYYENKLRNLATQAHPLRKQQKVVAPEIVAETDRTDPEKNQPLRRMAPVGNTPRAATPPPTPPPAGRGASSRKTETTVGKPPLSTREEVSHSAITALPQPEYQPISLNQAPLPAGGGVGGGVALTALKPIPQPEHQPIPLNQAPLPAGGGVGGGVALTVLNPLPQPEHQPIPLNQAPLPAGGGAGSGVAHTVLNPLPQPEHQPIPLNQAPLPAGGGAGSGVAHTVLNPLPQPEHQPIPLNQAPLPAGGGVGGGVALTALKPIPQPEHQPIPLNQAPLPAGGGVGGGVPARVLSGWYIGLHATPHRAFETATPTAHRPGMRPVLTGQSEHPEVATGWWLRIGKSVGHRWGLESGIGFSESTRTTAHTARFRFADGDIHPGGPGPIGQRRNFSYDLNTYGGSASVSLRMESADASAPVTEAEPVVVKISTTEHAQLLRIPLLLTCRMGSGRLTAVAKAGLTGNFFLKNDLAISARTSQNNRLRFAQNTDNFAFERSGNFFLGYWASAGLEYRWNRRLSLVAEPAVSGNFARKDAQGRRLPDQVLAGVNVGLNWRL